MKYFISTLTLLFLCSLSLFAQGEPSESIEFPTISNNQNINLDDTVQCTNGEHPDSAKKRKEQRRAIKETVKGKNFGFYTDLIYGSVFMVVCFIGWKLYQRFSHKFADDEDEDEDYII